MGPIFEQLKREMSGGRVNFVRYNVPANGDGSAIVEDLILRGYIATHDEKDSATGAVNQMAEMGCFSGTGRICVFGSGAKEFAGDISASHSFESAREKILGMLAD